MATHFDIEEQIMQALGFPALRNHVRSHAASAAQLNDICRASLGRGSSMSAISISATRV